MHIYLLYISIVFCQRKKKRKQYTWRKDPTKRRWNDTPPSVNTELFPRCIPLVRSVYVRIIYITPTISFQLAQQPTLSLLVCICICTRIYVYIYTFLYYHDTYARYTESRRRMYLAQSRCFYRSFKHPRGDRFWSNDQTIN